MNPSQVLDYHGGFRQDYPRMPWRAYTRCPVGPSATEVTSIRPDTEIDPRAVGANPDDINGAWHAITRLYTSGTHPAVSLCVRRRGEVLLDRAIGHVSGTHPEDPPGTPQIPVSYETPFCLASASKPITAMMIHLLVDRGQIRLDDPVAKYLSDFGQRGKAGITIRHLLTHRAGIAITPRESIDLDLLASPEAILTRLYTETPTYEPGRHMGYHALTSGFLFAAIVEAVTSQTIDDLLRQEIRAPLGMRWLGYGVPSDELGLVARNAFTGTPVPPPLSWLIDRALGMDIPQAATMLNDPRFLASIVPSANIVATAAETTLFFELLRRGGVYGDRQIFARQTIVDATTGQSCMEPDATLLLPFRYGMGFMLGGEYASLFGLHAPNAFGHIGLTNTLCWADPDRDLSVALLTSGKPILYPELLSLLEAVFRIAQACPRDGSGIGGD